MSPDLLACHAVSRISLGSVTFPPQKGNFHKGECVVVALQFSKTSVYYSILESHCLQFQFLDKFQNQINGSKNINFLKAVGKPFSNLPALLLKQSEIK